MKTSSKLTSTELIKKWDSTCKLLRRMASIAVLVLAAIAFVSSAYGTVGFVGNDNATDRYWRTASVSKPNDWDADNIYGTAGYYLPKGLTLGYNDPWMPAGETNVAGAWNSSDINTMPAWFQGLVVTNADRLRSWGGDGGNFGFLDNVGGGHKGVTGAPMLLRDQSKSVQGFLFKRSASPAFRLTLIFGNSTESAAGQTVHTVTVDDGSGAITADSALPTFTATGKSTYQSWDISAGSSDILIVLLNTANFHRLAGIAVDTAAVIRPTISSQPQGGTYLAGANVSLSGVLAGTAPTFQWYKGAVAMEGKTNQVLNFPAISLGDTASYYFIATNSAGSVTSSVVSVSVLSTLPPGQVAYAGAVTSEASLISYYPFDLQNANDAFGTNDGSAIGGISYSPSVYAGASKSATFNGGQVDVGNVPAFQFADGSGTVEMWMRCGWVGFTPNSEDVYLFACQDTINGVNYSVSVNSGRNQFLIRNGSSTTTLNVNGGLGNAWHHLAFIFDSGTVTAVLDGLPISDAFSPSGAGASFQIGSSIPVDGGNSHWIGDIDEVAIYGDALSTNTMQSHFLLGPTPPVITTQPVGQTAFVGDGIASLSVVATGPNLRYQWYKSDSGIAGATNASYSLGGTADFGDAGSYQVVVSNQNLALTSSVVSIAVYLPAENAYEAAVKSESSLISLYTFDTEDTNNTTVLDVKGSNNGTVSGVPLYSSGLGGGTNRAFVFDGSSLIQFGQVPAFAFTNKVGTFEALLRNDYTNSAPFAPCFASFREGTTIYSLHSYQNSGGLIMWNDVSVLGGNGNMLAGGWHHVVVVFGDGGTTNTQFYFDGVRVASAEGYGPSDSDPTGLTAQIGSISGASASDPWSGAMDNVAYYSTALSSNAVASHFNALTVVTAPTLTITTSGGSATITWPAGYPGWVLESAASLSPASWAPIGSNSPVVVPVTSTNAFFRLHKP